MLDIAVDRFKSHSGVVRIAGTALSVCFDAIPDAKAVPLSLELLKRIAQALAGTAGPVCQQGD